jgi:ATP-dependent helicase HrpA
LLQQGRDLGELIERFRTDTRQSISSSEQISPAREGVSRWDFGELPREWRFRQAGVDIVSYPALVDKEQTVAIELCDYPGEARLRHRLGVLRLLRLGNAPQVKYLRKQMLRGNEFNLVLAGAGLDRAALIEDLIDGAYVQATRLDRDLPYDEEAFGEVMAGGKSEVITRANEMETVLLNFLKVLAELRHKLAGLDAGKWLDSRADVEQQLQHLLQAGFQRDTPREWSTQYPRYLKALRTRVERLSGQYAKDQKHTALLQTLAQPLWDSVGERPGLLLLCAPAMQYRWMLEELRVSLFAQNLGTRQAVSQKRLQEQWRLVLQWLAQNP